MMKIITKKLTFQQNLQVAQNHKIVAKCIRYPLVVQFVNNILNSAFLTISQLQSTNNSYMQINQINMFTLINLRLHNIAAVGIISSTEQKGKFIFFCSKKISDLYLLFTKIYFGNFYNLNYQILQKKFIKKEKKDQIVILSKIYNIVRSAQQSVFSEKHHLM